MRLKAITPRGKGFDPKRPKTDAALLRIGRATQGTASIYPTARTSYRRTGELGRRWTVRGPLTDKGARAVIVGTNLNYASFVKGLKTKDPKQLSLFKRYGWSSIVDDAEAAFQQQKGGLIAALVGK